MKILLILPDIPSVYGGGSYRMYQQYNFFINDKSVYCDTVILSNKKDNRFKILNYKFSSFEKVFNFFRPFAYPVCNHIENELENIVKNNHYDLIICYKFYTAFYLRKLKNKKNIIVDLWATGYHGIKCEILYESNLFVKIRKIIQFLRHYLTDKYMYKLFDNYFVVSDISRKYIESKCKNKKVYIIPHGFEPQKIDFNVKRKNNFVFIGDLNFKPNIDSVYFIYKRLLPELFKKGVYVNFYVIGDYSRSKLNQQINSKYITFTGRLNQDEIDKYMRENRFFYSYLKGGAGLRTKVVLAFSYAMCVVANKNSLEGIDYINNNVAVVAENLDDIVDKITFIIKNERHADEIGLNAYNYVDKYLRPDKIYNKIKEAINEIYNRNNY